MIATGIFIVLISIACWLFEGRPQKMVREWKRGGKTDSSISLRDYSLRISRGE